MHDIKKRKHILGKMAVGMFAICVAGLFSGCGTNGSNGALENETADSTGNQKKLQVVTTIFPEYDWVKEILGEQADEVDLTLLLGNGVDMHSFQPTMEDILKVSTCDVFIYVGGESDSWVADALKGAGNPDRKAINLLEVLGDQAKEEEIVEGMQDEEGHSHGNEENAHTEDEDVQEGDVTDHDSEDVHETADHDAGDVHEADDAVNEKDENTHEAEAHTHHDHDEVEYDEHVWLSLKNASVFCDAITAALGNADPEHAELYEKNASAYEEKLAALDEEYKNLVDNSQLKTLLFADRFPFRYLTDDYGLTYYAAFTGCSAETDASFETITFLAGKLDELKLPAVLTIENSDQKVAKAVIENTKTKDQKILTLDSMQSTTLEEIEKGTTYLSIMEGNLKVLEEAL